MLCILGSQLAYIFANFKCLQLFISNTCTLIWFAVFFFSTKREIAIRAKQVLCLPLVHLPHFPALLRFY